MVVYGGVWWSDFTARAWWCMVVYVEVASLETRLAQEIEASEGTLQ